MCEALGRVTPTEHIDHIIPLSKGGPDTDGNTSGLCESCHKQKTRKDMGQQEKPTFGADGYPVEL
ncbi:HNH endonuclease [Algimonas porphyrae]|uniref:HNH domain-containing protein n=1 Tax=Algimonas porphyrae TaxID=1128113 RepID=A0ABQ5V040_9PROT|nr:hypothetical protein GCM10007854_13350 [Algimonas porphyrae]